MTHRLLARLLLCIALAGGLTGCGSASSAARPSAAPAPAAQAGVPGAVWQSELERREQGKIALPLWRWLDGDAAEGLGPLAAEDGSVRVEVLLRHGLYEDEVDHYARLGLAAAEGDDRPLGMVSREQLLELAKDHNVLRLDAARAADSPAASGETATAQADSSDPTPAL